MAIEPSKPDRIDLRGRLTLTLAGLWAERLCAAFWPVWSVLFAVLAFFFMGLHEVLQLEIVWGFFVLAGALALFGLWFAARRFEAPSKLEALDRIDAALPGRPIHAVRDKQAIGAQDAASKALWHEYQRRMYERIRAARSIPPKVRLAAADPFGLRFVAVLALLVSLMFGSVWRLGTVGDIGAPGTGAALATGPSWEGWVEPPRYTGLPAMYLTEIADAEIELPQGSEVTLRLYGDVGAVTVSETVSSRIGDVPSAAAREQSFRVMQSGDLSVNGGAGERSWSIVSLPDKAPIIEATGPAEASASGAFTMPFEAYDDYGIESGTALIELDLAQLDRRFGLALVPEDMSAIELPVPLPVAGSRKDFEETLLEDFSKHVWANLPVKITLTATDEAGNEGASYPAEMTLAARHFFNPSAAAVIELRRDLLWNRENGARVAQLLRAISHRPGDVFKSETDYLRLRTILRRLEAKVAYGGLDDETRDRLTEAMWELALNLEDGNLSDALERMRDAQEKLSEAMRNGASEEEVARLMDELREATQDYMKQLAQRDPDEQNGEAGERGESMQMSQQDLQDMMDRIQELMEQGRMAEAEQALKEFQEMMENMRVTQNQQGEGQSEGQQAMEGLSDTLREQQGLSDQAFRDLQEQFNPNARAGENAQNEGRNGGQGRGQEHEGQGEGEGEGQGREGKQGQGGKGGEEGQGADGRSLAERQQELRRRLAEQQNALPGLSGEAGEAMREALEGAESAMGRAEEELRQNQLADALNSQAEAMENLREGMDNLGEAMAQAQQGQAGQEGDSQQAGPNGDDRLGRNRRGFSGDEDVYRRARELLDEIRRRSGENTRSETERNYLRRLLERFGN